jgi:hypothetical protein
MFVAVARCFCAELSDKITWFLAPVDASRSHELDVNNNDDKSSEVNANQIVVNRFWKVHQRLSGPFASPLTYAHLSQLADIQLHLIGSHICPLLDDAIQMYHEWKGERSLLMFDDLPHGFIQFVDQCKQSRKATSQIGDLIRRTLDEQIRKEREAAPALNLPVSLSPSVTVGPQTRAIATH